jgi:hypothetical protein
LRYKDNYYNGEERMRMERGATVFLLAGIALAAPGALSAAAGALEAVAGVPATRPIAAAFAYLGVTNQSPLPVRQAWYLGVYILGPLAAVAIGAIGAARTRPRWPFALIATVAAALAVFWTVRSLLDD